MLLPARLTDFPSLLSAELNGKLGQGEAVIRTNSSSKASAKRVVVQCDIRLLSGRVDDVNKTEGNRLCHRVRIVASEQKTIQITYVDNALDLAEDSRDRRANEGNPVEEPGLANQDVEEDLVNTPLVLIPCLLLGTPNP